MATTKNMWINPRPVLVVERTGGSYANCLSRSTFRITSTRRLSREHLDTLRGTGAIGYGQIYTLYAITAAGERTSVTDDTAPAGVDSVQCAEVDALTGKVIRTPAINPYSGVEYPPHEFPYWVYECLDTVDSSD